jgi:hypothetical protein
LGNSAEFRKKAETIAATMDLYVPNIDEEGPFGIRAIKWTVSEEIEDLVSQAKLNPNAILHGTFHRYPFNEA